MSLLKHFSSGCPNIKPLAGALPLFSSFFDLAESKKLVVNAFRLSNRGARRLGPLLLVASAMSDSIEKILFVIVVAIIKCLASKFMNEN